MAQQTVNIGNAANDGTGDPIRTAFDKVNDNFDELYPRAPSSLPVLVSEGGTGGTTAEAARAALGVPAIPVSVANGGHAGTTTAEAQSNLGIPTSAAPLSVARGGHAGTTTAEAQANLGIPTSGSPLAIARGGHAGTTAAEARTNLGVPGIPVPVAQGGHAGTTTAEAQANLGIIPGIGAVTDRAGVVWSGTTGRSVASSSWTWGTATATQGTPLDGADLVTRRQHIQDYSEVVQQLGTITAGTTTINLESGNVAQFTGASGTAALAVTNWPASGRAGNLTLYITNGGQLTLTWPANTIWPGGAAPTLTSTGTDMVVLSSLTAGTTAIFGNSILDLS